MNPGTEVIANRVIIVGVGLIGGSIAAAVRKRMPTCEVIGAGRSPERLQAAQEAGLLTQWTTDISAQMLSKDCVVIVCLPVDLIADEVCRLSELAADGVLITDAGSIKGHICDEVNSHSRGAALFVGAHPIAGGELGGFEHADADLFVDRVCVITSAQDEPKTTRAAHFWAAIGCQIHYASAFEHDRVLALTSHLPHVMAAATTTVVGLANLGMTGSGFRDTTRIAAGDPSIWSGILTGNAAQISAALLLAERQLAAYRIALESSNSQALTNLLSEAADCRSRL